MCVQVWNIDFKNHFTCFFLLPQVSPVGSQVHPPLLRGPLRAAYFSFTFIIIKFLKTLIGVIQVQETLLKKSCNCIFSRALEAKLSGPLKGRMLQCALSKEARKNSPQKILLLLYLVLLETQWKDNIKELWRTLSCMFSNRQINLGCKYHENAFCTEACKLGLCPTLK